MRADIHHYLIPLAHCALRVLSLVLLNVVTHSIAAETVAAEKMAATPAMQRVHGQLAAATARRMKGVLDTTTRRDELTLIFPDRTISSSRQKYIGLHSEWVADQGWTMGFRIVQVMQAESMAALPTKAHNTDGSMRIGRKSGVTFVFALEEGRRRQRFDQDTAQAAR
jgi:hypothetical protein